MASVEHRLAMAQRDLMALVQDLYAWLDGLGPAERVLGICGFCLVILWLTIRRPSAYENRRQMGRQFNMALVTVILFGLGAGWIFQSYARLAMQFS